MLLTSVIYFYSCLLLYISYKDFCNQVLLYFCTYFYIFLLYICIYTLRTSTIHFYYMFLLCILLALYFCYLSLKYFSKIQFCYLIHLCIFALYLCYIVRILPYKITHFEFFFLLKNVKYVPKPIKESRLAIVREDSAANLDFDKGLGCINRGFQLAIGPLPPIFKF